MRCEKEVIHWGAYGVMGTDGTGGCGGWWFSQTTEEHA